MGNANTVHRPLMAGLEIRSKIPGSNQSNRGTLTGLATRNSNGEKVLVSNLHVMTDDKFNPSTNAEIYQPDATDLNHKVGRLFKWVPLKTALPNENVPSTPADVAMAHLDSNVDAGFKLHSAGHNLGVVLSGTRRPIVGTSLTMVGAEGGVGVVRVRKLDREVHFSTEERVGNYTVERKGKYTGFIELDCNQRPVQPADSGAPCLVQERPGQFHMACILVSRLRNDGRTAYAFRASVAESELDITFGTSLASNDATLSALSIAPTPASVVPVFSGATTDYRATVGNDVASVRVRPTVNQANATVTVNGVTIASGQASHAITLPVGVRTITVVVTAQDGTTRKTYTVAVTRATAAGIQGMTHTINVGAPSNNDPQLFIWTPIPRLAVPGALMANGQTAYLEFLEITNWPYIAIRMSSAQSGSPAASQAGPDFTPSFEQSGIIRFVASDGSQVEFTGIGDSAEPYGWWVRGPSDRANASAWITRVNGLTDKTCRLQLVAPASTTPANQAPTANAGRDQSVSAGALVTLSGSGSDPDSGDTLTYSWTQIGTPAVTLSNSWISNPTFTAPRPSATLTFRLTVTDNHGASDTDDVTITVRAPARTNRAPTANAGSNQTVSLGATVTLRGSGMDPDRDTLSYSWLQTRGSPTVNLSGANTATASFTAPNNLPLGGAELTFQLTVSDNRGGTDTDDVTIVINRAGVVANRAPTANAGPDRTVNLGAQVTLSGSGSDPDEDTLSYSWSQTGGSPTVTLSGANTATASFTAPNNLPPGGATLTFRLTVSDSQGGTDTDDVTITVTR